MNIVKKVFCAMAALLLGAIVATMILPMLLLLAPVGLFVMPLVTGALVSGARGGLQRQDGRSTARPAPAREYVAPIVLPRPRQGWWPQPG